MKIQRVTEIYAELEKCEITLDADPVSRGPRYLQSLISVCRNYLNSVSRLLLEVHREKQDTSRDLRAREAAFQVSFDSLLATDERIRKLPNIEDRKSTAKLFLREDVTRIDDLKGQLQDLDYVEKAIRHRHRELTASMSEIKLQKSLISNEIQTGAMYGDERTYTDGPAGVAPVDFDEEELDALYESTVVQTKAPTPSKQKAPEPPPVIELEPEPEPVSLEQGVETFLGAGPKVDPALVDDYDKYLQDILAFLLSFCCFSRGDCASKVATTERRYSRSTQPKTSPTRNLAFNCRRGVFPQEGV